VRTIFLATHNMAEVDAICNRVAIIDRGRILTSDTPTNLKRSLGAPALVMEVSPLPVNLAFLGAVEGVKGFTTSVDEERGLARVQVVVESEECVRRALAGVAASGMRLVSSWRQQTTLEEVFVSLVGRGFVEREHEVGE